MEINKIAKIYVGECSDCHSVGRPWKKCIDTEKLLEEKRYGYQATKENGAVHDGGLCGNEWGVTRRMNP